MDSIQIYTIVKMVGDELANFESKGHSSISGNFSTSESAHSKPLQKQEHFEQKCSEGEQPRQNYDLGDCKNNQTKSYKIDDQMQNRLFTFMDEKDCQKKIIQNFIFSRTNYHHYHSDQNQENNAQLLNIANAGILKIIKDSKDKEQKIQKNIASSNFFNKQIKSNQKLSFNKSKTSKNAPKFANKYITIDPKSDLDSHKYKPYRSITPKYQRQKKMIRAKSSLDNNIFFFEATQKKFSDLKKQKIDKHDDIKKGNEGNRPLKQLLKKKKQLEKQLNEINSSLLCRKKKTSQVTTNKPLNLKTIKNRKKSASKLVNHEQKSFRHLLI